MGSNEYVSAKEYNFNFRFSIEKGSRTVVMKGSEYKGWVYVNENSIKTKKDLNYWVGLALDFNKRAKASKKSKKT